MQHGRSDADKRLLTERDALDAATIGSQPCSLPDHDTGPNFSASRDYRVRPYLRIVTYVAKIIDLCPAQQASCSKSGAVNNGSRTYLHIVLNEDYADLWEMLPASVSRLHETESSIPDNCVGLEEAPFADH